MGTETSSIHLVAVVFFGTLTQNKPKWLSGHSFVTESSLCVLLHDISLTFQIFPLKTAYSCSPQPLA